LKKDKCAAPIEWSATLGVFREVWAIGIAAQLKIHASRKLPLVARARAWQPQRGSLSSYEKIEPQKKQNAGGEGFPMPFWILISEFWLLAE
jgi:hypothetical protein